MPVQCMEEVTKLGRNFLTQMFYASAMYGRSDKTWKEFFNTDQQQDCVKSHNITQYGSESCTSLDM